MALSVSECPCMTYLGRSPKQRPKATRIALNWECPNFLNFKLTNKTIHKPVKTQGKTYIDQVDYAGSEFDVWRVRI